MGKLYSWICNMISNTSCHNSNLQSIKLVYVDNTIVVCSSRKYNNTSICLEEVIYIFNSLHTDELCFSVMILTYRLSVKCSVCCEPEKAYNNDCILCPTQNFPFHKADNYYCNINTTLLFRHFSRQ